MSQHIGDGSPSTRYLRKRERDLLIPTYPVPSDGHAYELEFGQLAADANEPAVWVEETARKLVL